MGEKKFVIKPIENYNKAINKLKNISRGKNEFAMSNLFSQKISGGKKRVSSNLLVGFFFVL